MAEWTFARFVRPVLINTIFCIREICYRCIHVSRIISVGPKKNRNNFVVVLIGDVRFVKRSRRYLNTNYWRRDFCIKQTSGSKQKVLIQIRRLAQSLRATSSRCCALKTTNHGADILFSFTTKPFVTCSTEIRRNWTELRNNEFIWNPLTLLLQGSKSVRMLIYLPRYNGALKSRTLSNPYV